ncbi:MAG TPA: isoleucine--tRNA ligase [Acidimicrobiales bacterium]|nr:isoleucine--tRNA ligase [Acidimicrobiales bacterium]
MPDRPYPDVPQQPTFPAVEARILQFWREEHIFERSVERRPAGDGGSNEYVFYDGPPFANGLPHYGHLLTGFVKDAVPRYQTMKGRRVERRFGWDCHGLPAEMEAEKELGISGHVAISEYGIARFNDACRTSVLRYTREWQQYVTRQARWVDFDHDYKTLDLPYMESVMWAFKELWEKGLVYEGYKVLPYCWECETPLSNFETRLDDAYRERQDPAVTVLFELDPPAGGERPYTEEILVWTTTPWTLPSNLALAVGEDIDYAVFSEGDRRFLVGEATAAKYERELAGAERLGTVKGSELVGRSYRPLFDYFRDTPNAFRVLAADFVSTEEGTGTVHLAPGFGEDDQRACEAAGIPVVAPIDEHARFTSEVPDYRGLQVFDANPRILADLKQRGSVVRHDTYVHSYPHCWRTDTPLVYKAVSSWFVEVTRLKDRALELNQQITWVPAQMRDGAFGSWLANARDWCISRNRFWGSPIPVWKSDDPAYPRVDVYGSIDELARDFGVRPDDLHRPAIDQLTRPNPDDPTGRSTMRRVEEVLDCWFESGSMPYAQVHYPFENRDWFESHFPADFIVEYVGQTRAWFYNLHVLATALFDRPAFTTCVVHGVVLGDDGRKASKRLRNYVDPEEMFETYGADAVRWFLLSSAVLRGQDLLFTRQGVADAMRRVVNPIWNTWYFFSLYANTEGYRARSRIDAGGVIDRYVLAKARELLDAFTERMDAYDLAGACASVESFLDALTNWYVRRSRDRFWAGDEDAFDTLSTVLSLLCRIVAPLLPMVSEEVYRGLTGEESVHLTAWPSPDEVPADPGLVASMDRVREVCSAASSVRKAANLRVRLPLRSLTVAVANSESLRPFVDLIADEVNVKTVILSDDVGAHGELVLQLVPSVLGPRVGADVQKLIKAVKSGEWLRTSDGRVVVGDRTLADDEYTLRLVAADEVTTRVLPGNAGLVVLDVDVTPELAREGLARDVVRLANEARKEARLHVADRIRLLVEVAHDEVWEAVETFQDYVAAETLAVEVLRVPELTEGHRCTLPDGRALVLGVAPRSRGGARG